jgi:hypothetical protein
MKKLKTNVQLNNAPSFCFCLCVFTPLMTIFMLSYKYFHNRGTLTMVSNTNFHHNHSKVFPVMS